MLSCNFSTCLFLLIKPTVWGICEEKGTDTLKPQSSIFIKFSKSAEALLLVNSTKLIIPKLEINRRFLQNKFRERVVNRWENVPE